MKCPRFLYHPSAVTISIKPSKTLQKSFSPYPMIPPHQLVSFSTVPWMGRRIRALHRAFTGLDDLEKLSTGEVCEIPGIPHDLTAIIRKLDLDYGKVWNLKTWFSSTRGNYLKILLKKEWTECDQNQVEISKIILFLR